MGYCYDKISNFLRGSSAFSKLRTFQCRTKEDHSTKALAQRDHMYLLCCRWKVELCRNTQTPKKFLFLFFKFFLFIHLCGTVGRQLALLPHSNKVLRAGVFLCRVCMLFPCLRGFSPSAPASSQSPKICSYTGIGGGEWMDGWKQLFFLTTVDLTEMCTVFCNTTTKFP